jgi:hypothetical protein
MRISIALVRKVTPEPTKGILLAMGVKKSENFQIAWKTLSKTRFARWTASLKKALSNVPLRALSSISSCSGGGIVRSLATPRPVLSLRVGSSSLRPVRWKKSAYKSGELAIPVFVLPFHPNLRIVPQLLEADVRLLLEGLSLLLQRLRRLQFGYTDTHGWVVRNSGALRLAGKQVARRWVATQAGGGRSRAI